MKNFTFLIAFLFTFLFIGCANHSKKTIFAEGGNQAYELEEISSWGFFAPTYQLQRAKVCEVKETLVKTTNHGSGYTSREAINCRLLTAADGYHKDLGAPVGPALMQAGGTVGAGYLIGDGIRDSNDTINNTNQQGQLQGQQQYQKQRSFNYNRNSNSNFNANCNGFFC